MKLIIILIIILISFSDSFSKRRQRRPTKMPTIFPKRKSPWLCYNGCFTSHDSICDDGGSGSTNGWCPWGSDCADCGTRDS